MTATDRQAFEEHYFNCPECLEAITYASDFLEVGREYVQENGRTQPAPAPVPNPAWYQRIFSTSWWSSPVPAFASAVFLALFGFSIYQGVELAQARKSVNTPTIVTASVFLPRPARGADTSRGPELHAVGRKQTFVLDVDLPESFLRYPAYEGEIVSEAGSVVMPTFSLSAENLNQGSRVEIAIPPTLSEGAYRLVIRGIKEGAKEKPEIARYDFVIKFRN
jgi:hypothetical protein